MDPQPQPARAPGASVELAPAAHGVAVNDEDLLSRDAQQAMQRIADPLAFLLVLFFIVGAASRPQQLRRRLADVVVGVLPVGTGWWRRLMRMEHLVKPEAAAAVAHKGVRAADAKATKAWASEEADS